MKYLVKEDLTILILSRNSFFFGTQFQLYVSYVFFDVECESDVKNSIKLKATPKMG